LEADNVRSPAPGATTEFRSSAATRMRTKIIAMTTLAKSVVAICAAFLLSWHKAGAGLPMLSAWPRRFWRPAMG
jgi:hypothetical protein